MRATASSSLPPPPFWVRATAWCALLLVGALLWLAYDFESHARLHHHAHAAVAAEEMSAQPPLSPLLARALAHACSHHGCRHHAPAPADPAPACDEGCVITLFAQDGVTLITLTAAPALRLETLAECTHPDAVTVLRPQHGAHAPTRGPPARA